MSGNPTASAHTVPRAGSAVGTLRPVYFWAGAATARFQRIKFQGAAVDEAAHRAALTHEGIARLAAAGFNAAFLAANWGFPPEIEEADWREFESATELCQAHGIRTFAYIQGSNCFDLGSYRSRDWWARTPGGRRIPYYAGRYMTCLHSKEWVAEVEDRIERAVRAGADGVYFDNVWMGATPWLLGPTYGGFAGCACARCRDAYRAATGSSVPSLVDPERRESRSYLQWRAGIVTERLREWAAHARSLAPDTLVGANACAGVMRHAYIAFGIDYAAWSEFLDLVLVEDVALPDYRPGRSPRLTQAAVTAKAVRAVASPAIACTVSYDRGIGLDAAARPRRYRQALAEAAACGAVGVVKGTEYLDADGHFTVFTAPEFDALRAECGAMLDWLADHSDLYRDRAPAAALGLLYPYPAEVARWERWAPSFFAAAQSLLAGGIPFRLITDRHTSVTGLQALVMPSGVESAEAEACARHAQSAGARLVRIPGDLFRGPFSQQPPITVRTPRRRRWLSPLFQGAHRAYFTRRLVRELMHRTGLVKLGMQPPYFRIPDQARRFIELLEPVPAPRARAGSPMLVEHWHDQDAEHLHAVNYDRTPQTVRLDLGTSLPVTVRSPDSATVEIEPSDDELELDVDVYAIVSWPRRARAPG